jgi:hypothetical protein
MTTSKTIIWHGPSYGAALELACLLWARHRIPVEIKDTDGITRVLFTGLAPGEFPDLETVQEIVREEFQQAAQITWCVQFSEIGEITEEEPRAAQ